LIFTKPRLEEKENGKAVRHRNSEEACGRAEGAQGSKCNALTFKGIQQVLVLGFLFMGIPIKEMGLRGWRCSSEIECMPSICKALDSIPSTPPPSKLSWLRKSVCLFFISEDD
jgi:hypothetical protein